MESIMLIINKTDESIAPFFLEIFLVAIGLKFVLSSNLSLSASIKSLKT